MAQVTLTTEFSDDAAKPHGEIIRTLGSSDKRYKFTACSVIILEYLQHSAGAHN